MHMEKEKAKIGFVSLGCSKNQVNTERMMYLVREAGYQIVPEDIDADVMVINTCAFIVLYSLTSVLYPLVNGSI